MPHALTIQRKAGRSGNDLYPLYLKAIPKPNPGPGEVLVRLKGACLNHRDYFIRKNLYPKIAFKAPLLSDACGVVIEEGKECRLGLFDKSVILTPCRGWKSSTDGPEAWTEFATIGGTEPYIHLGGAQTYVVVDETEVEVCPEHLSHIEAAALPSAGLTAWRALMTKSDNAFPGRNILLTGIGGGVALQLLQFGVALGCNMFVTSSSAEKITRAQEMGAKGGVNYKLDGWNKTLMTILPTERPYIDAVIDGAGDTIVTDSIPLLKPGGVIVCYGMTVAAVMDWPMQAVLKNIELRGSTLGSRVEFAQMVEFVREKKIRPIISRTVKGLECVEAIDSLFEDIKHGKQFGKLGIEI